MPWGEIMKVSLTVDGRVIQGNSGQNLLQVCLENGIHIPNLCYIDNIRRPLASCRLCFVEIEGEAMPVTSCTQGVTGGMIVRTDSEAVRHLQRSALELLLSVHRVDCGHCPVNKKCELQRLASRLKVGLKSGSLDKHLKEMEISESHPGFNYYPNRCVLCGKCEYICRERNEKPVLSFVKRGLDTMISLHWEGDTMDVPCQRCHGCIDICPVGAITAQT
jgi:bidirectional [NiFe] hydrogenase diaphorase subunit